ncbi:uncharacterized protein LOC127702771 [Mytilus californianus]|uniref:uncharacterized protein LOC127702771 n=1 Tax=Mytilus californianus TaxID=6549 RepID=UPI002247E9A4|nr:uncharacterized protein LOC127702771 [Mytilus californianus]
MEETTYNVTTTMIQHCNVTGRWNFIDERLQIQCRQLPQIDFHFPYKNIFCKMCNEERVEYDKCRDIVCYPGRVLINGTCIPLLPYTSNLGYTLTFGVHVQSEAPIKNTRYLLQKIEEEILIQLAFIVPIMIMCLLNIFFFIYSAHSIATTPKLKNDDSYQQNSVNLAVYIKLFTITGSSWVIQIIDSFLPLSFFSIIVSLLNALQGVYIFVAYICNKRVFILYRSLICNKAVFKFGSESRNVTRNETLTSTKL